MKLGYGGTKEEMQRLLKDAEKFSGVKYDIANLNDVYEAIHVVQTELGITGTTAKEASTTIQGSVASMKSAWQNLVTAIASDGWDIGVYVSNFVDSAVTAGKNIIPRVEQIIQGLAELISEASDTLIPLIVDTIVDNLPMLIEAGVELIVALAGALIDAIPDLLKALPKIIGALVNGLISLGGKLKDAGASLMGKIKSAIMEKVNAAKQWGKDLISNFINGITAKAQALIAKVKSVAQSVKNFLGFSEPKEGPLSNFHTYAPDMMELFAKGIKDNEKLVTGQIEKSFDFGDRIYTASDSKKAQTSAKTSTDALLEQILVKLSRMGLYIDGQTLVGYVDNELGGRTASSSRLALA